MNFKDLIDDVIKAAKTASVLIPGAPAAIAIGEKLVGIIDDLTDKAPDTRTQTEMQEARRALAATVSAKAERTADRFD